MNCWAVIRVFVIVVLLLEVILPANGSSFEIKIERRTKREVAERMGFAYPKSTSEDPIKIPLNGIYAGLYYMSFQVGTPPKTFAAQVDTGSSDLALPSSMCSVLSCGSHQNPYYDPEQSTTSNPLGCVPGNDIVCKKCSQNQCSYSTRYLDGSGYTAIVYNDTLQMGSSFHSPQIFGGITEVSGTSDFEPYNVDGILGLGYRSLSRINAPTLMDNVVLSGGEDVFSMCVVHGGGSITFGGIAPYYSGKIQYTPIIDELFYKVYVTDLLINDESIGISQYDYNYGGAIVDSGTSDLILPQSAYDRVSSIVKGFCSKEVNLPGLCEKGEALSKGLFEGYCFSMTDAQLQNFPTLSIEFNGGATVDISPQNWIVQGYCENLDLYALAISSVPITYGTLLGDTFMRNVLTVFDRNNQRIGLAPVNNCPTS